jgi:hypothetical protein
MGEKEEIVKFLEQALDIREWLARLDTKLDGVNGNVIDLKNELSETKKEASDAKAIANRALIIAEDNSKDIDDIKSSDRWKWGMILGTFGSLIVAVTMYLLNQ